MEGEDLNKKGKDVRPGNVRETSAVVTLLGVFMEGMRHQWVLVFDFIFIITILVSNIIM